jgi:hypothetical protein
MEFNPKIRTKQLKNGWFTVVMTACTGKVYRFSGEYTKHQAELAASNAKRDFLRHGITALDHMVLL